jgi:hypothetical protein
MELAGRFGHTAARDAEHVGDELLGHQDLVRLEAIEAEEKPAAELLIDGVMTVAHRGLRHLRDQGLRIAQEQAVQRAASGKLVVDVPGA